MRLSFRAVRDPQEPVSQPDSAAQKVEFPGSINSPKPVASQPLALRLLRGCKTPLSRLERAPEAAPTRCLCTASSTRSVPPEPPSFQRLATSVRCHGGSSSGCAVVTTQELPTATAMQCPEVKFSGSPDGARCSLSSHWAEALFRVAGWVATQLPRRAPRAPMRVSRTLASSWCWPRAPRSSALFHPSSDPP